MKKISFVKYTSYGNNFVIIDDSVTQNFTESEMSCFAYEATNSCFGIGSDNLLVIQRCNQETLEAIRDARGYWRKTPDSQDAEFIFRMFEPNGDEAFSCGNGLMCIAAHLAQQHDIRSTRIMTEIPFASPKTIAIGSTGESSWAHLDHPRRVPSELAHPAMRKSLEHDMDFVGNLSVHFRSHDLAPYTDEVSLKLSGFLIFTGEPHLVIFPDEGFSDTELGGTIFDYPATHVVDPRKIHRRANFGSWLINRIGSYVNTHCLDRFPAGLNINFARVQSDPGVVEYRCFERGINRETMACGTGALAVAYVARRLNLIKTKTINVLPHQCRQFQPDAQIEVQEREYGWMLNGDPTMLIEGTFMLTSSQQARPVPAKSEIVSDTAVVTDRGAYGHLAVAAS